MGELVRIAGQCDGVRCDMAMLMLNDVFTRTWGDRVGLPEEVRQLVELGAHGRLDGVVRGLLPVDGLVPGGGLTLAGEPVLGGEPPLGGGLVVIGRAGRGGGVGFGSRAVSSVRFHFAHVVLPAARAAS